MTQFKFYVVFKPGTFLQSCHAVYDQCYGSSVEMARPIAHGEIYNLYSDTVDGIYDNEQAAGVERYGLPEVPWGTPNFKPDKLSNIARSRLARNISRG